MPLHASWVHGNALTVQSPQFLSAQEVGHGGWGADYSVIPGKATWMHIPVPTPVIVADVRTKFQKFFLLYEVLDGGHIEQVHIYDGSFKIQEFNNLGRSGAHRPQLDGANTFNLSAPHTVIFGIGITLLFIADIGFDSQIPPSRLILATAGVDFFT